MICAPETLNPQLTLSRRRGELCAVGQNKRMALLLEKSSRYDRLWEMADRWLNPTRWFR